MEQSYTLLDLAGQVALRVCALLFALPQCTNASSKIGIRSSSRLTQTMVLNLYNLPLDVDPARFNFTEAECYDRREYFWNLLPALLWTVSVCL